MKRASCNRGRETFTFSDGIIEKVKNWTDMIPLFITAGTRGLQKVAGAAEININPRLQKTTHTDR